MANFATLDSIRKKAEEEEEKQGNAYYAGGARGGGQGGSGLNVMGPPPDDDDDDSGGDPHVRQIFRRAEAGTPPTDDGSDASAQRTITMYNGGFTVDDGPFRRLEDAENKEFLKALAEGVVPRELESSATPGKPTEVRLVDKQSEDYVAPAYVAYGGEGQTMGSSAVVEEAVMTATEAPDAEDVPDVDDSQPFTTLQIRLHDGRRVRAKLNMYHTVRHIQAIIAREGAGGASYILMAGFPPTPLVDASQTLEKAGLKGTSITQKLA